ncbi:MAG: fluoride efflux transporter CrcB [Desulfovibrio sp.]|nr:fluoride efflux transporter CrcB [Desulfovibrio sp.]
MHTCLSLCFGASLGALLRYAISFWNGKQSLFPLGTLCANLLGAFLAGFFCALLLAHPSLERFRPFLMTGFLGALTTFSTFSLEVYAMLEAGRILQAFFCVTSHVLGSLAMTFLGFLSFRLLIQLGGGE